MSHISGSLVKRGNKWSVSYRVDGKQKTRSLGLDVRTTSKKVATAAMKRLLEQISSDNFEVLNMAFSEYLRWWLRQIKPLVKDSTFEGYYKSVEGKIAPYFEQYKLRLIDLRPMYFTEYFVYLKESGRNNGEGGLKRKSITNIRGVISSALDYAIENGFITENAALQARLPRFDQEEEHIPTIYSSEQVIKLLNYAMITHNKANLFLHIQVYTGCRKGEILGLTWDKIDFENATVSIEQNRTGNRKENYSKLTTPKSKNSVRCLALPPLLVELLQQEKLRQEENRQLLKDEYFEYDYDYVIRQDNGRIYNPNSINRILQKMMEQLGLPKCRPHDFRHFHATALFEYGKTPVSDITRQLGHSSTAITEKVYVHSSKQVNSDNVNIIRNILGDA